MAASNDSQGLKIAVAVFVTLTVVLAVTTYFGYSSYDQAMAKLADAEKKSSDSQRTAAEAINQLTDMKKIAGFEKVEEWTAVKDAVKKDDEKTKARLAEGNGKIKALVEQYKAAGGTQQKVDELSQAADQIIAQIANEPNQSYQARQERMLELLDNIEQLSAYLALDNEELRKSLTSVNGVNAQQLQIAQEALAKAKQDLESEHKTGEDERMKLHAKVDALQTADASKAAELAKLKGQLEQSTTEYDKTLGDLRTALRAIREQTEKNENVMDRPDGRITFVDHTRNEVRTTLNTRVGARPQMVFSVFDRSSAGLPTDRPKATIELISVDDRGSIGKVVKQTRTHEPIRNNDFVYSPTFDAYNKHYALIGKIDVDRDGRDDREDLKRMITSAGGVIDYDLPPSNIGRETGKITPLTSWYVLDDRKPIRGENNRSGRDPAGQDAGFLKKYTAAVTLARSEGVRPISVERLLAMLNYEFGAPVMGRVEAVNREAVEDLTRPRVGTPSAPRPADAAEPGTEGEPSDAKPDEAKPDDSKPDSDAAAPEGDDAEMKDEGKPKR